MSANKENTKEYAHRLRMFVDSTNGDFVKWSKKEWPPDGFPDASNVLGSALGSDPKKVKKWNDDYDFFRSWLRVRDRLKRIEERLDSWNPDYESIFDELRSYNLEVNAVRGTLKDRGGELSLEDMDPPSPGSYEPPLPPGPKGLSMTEAFMIIGGAAVVGGGIGYFLKRRRASKSLRSSSRSEYAESFRRMGY